MPNITNPYNFSDDSWSDPKNSKETKIKNKNLPLSKSSLHPIDETDEFHDPFSDLNLFLSKKIRSTVKLHGSTKKWSSKIQEELVSGILPEFKSKFPNYRLGISALKKVWEKVSYYYGKVSVQKEAILENGTLNIHYMIKQNLKDYLSKYQQIDSTPTATAHKLAVKLSECIATLEGERPRVDHLTKSIWAAQKHLLKNLPIKQSKNPFEEYDKVDKLIVKTLLEKTSTGHIKYEDLVKTIKRTLSKLGNYINEYKSQEIYQHIARSLANKLYPTSNLLKSLSESHTISIEQFILFQIETATSGEAQNLIEVTQRILALYPLITSLPKNLDMDSVKNAISHLLSENTGDSSRISNINPATAIFLTTEIHFIKRKELFSSYEEIEAHLLKTLEFSKELPLIEDHYLNDLEIFIWKVYNSLSKDDHKYEELIENELSVAILDSKSYSFQNTVYMVLHYFQKAKESLREFQASAQNDPINDLDRKIEIWSLQNDMLCRYLHFDPKHEILELMKKAWSESNFKSHQEFVDLIVGKYSQLHPSSSLSLNGLEKRVWILYKFFWYNQKTNIEETTFSRFAKWHFHEVTFEHSEVSKDQRMQILEKRILEKLPVTPFTNNDLKDLN